MRALLEEGFRAAVAAADPARILAPALPAPPKGRTFVAAVGKAAASMAAALEAAWPAEAALEGIALTRYRHAVPTRRIRVIEAGHPVPDAAGESAAREILAAAQALQPDDLLIALISGGGSSLLALPVEGVSMADLKALTTQLLHSGAPIQDINTVRKHLSSIQGGRLAAACRAPVRALIISDVTGDAPTHIASGPCAPDPTTYADARAVLAKHGVTPPPAIAEFLARGAAGRVAETPKPGSAALAHAENRVIATAHRALEAAASVFHRAGIAPAILGDTVTGEAAEVAKVMAALVREIRNYRAPFSPPVALISGGECTVSVGAAGGRGGRCAEFLLALAAELDGTGAVHAIAADTDGIDGSEDNAGAVLTPTSLTRARALGLDAARSLAAHDSYGFFAAIDDLVVTGPTYTNVNDFRAILVT
ncbi:MAG: hydroxypyruvate reductase [Betaproteobacteria bacterium SG8_39]|nr:MAG: hydroxypyruvate reductase [Betaproteobacteria bacterium SG8_39]